MRTTQAIEKVRVHRQHTLDAAKTQAERNRLGQFATPPRLALDIVRQSNEFLNEGEQIRFLDPAFGTGAFYSALRQVVPQERIQSATGFEIDPHYGDQARQLWSNSLLKLQIADFFSLPIPADNKTKANLTICNPPYVRHHHLSLPQKESMSRLTAHHVGLRVNGLSGLYCYFLIHAHNWLAEDGLGCWLIPTEFMDVNYGSVVREYLLRKVTLLRIHRFDPAESQFDDALVSSAVVWFRKTTPPADHGAELTSGGTLDSPQVTRKVTTSKLALSPKWSRFTNGHSHTDHKGAKISDFFDVKRGLATGDNGFFILTEAEVKQHRLPRKFLIPILPSPRYLTEDIVQADQKGNPLVEKKLFLLSCDLDIHAIKREYPSLWKYLESGRVKKIHERYLSSHRSPWYAQEKRPASPFLCTYMGRRDIAKGGPFRFILNLSNATAANVYLLLYPKLALKRLIEERPELLKTVWEALTDISPHSLVGEGRVYGGGLYKMEPRELANAPADGIIAAMPELRIEQLF